MTKKILSIIIALSVVLCSFPVYIRAEEAPGVPTRIQTERLILADVAAGDGSEGWQWTPDEAGGGTLILENCYIQSDGGFFGFDNLTNEKSDINIILRGRNILETKTQEYNDLISANDVVADGIKWDTSNYTISAEGEGSLEIRTTEDITSANSPYAFAAANITIESGDIKSNIGFCVILKEFSVHGGSLNIHTPAGIESLYGIYTTNGRVNISGGVIDIDGPAVGIGIAGIPPQNIGDQTINISGGDVNIKAGLSCLHINQNDMEGENTQTINITGGNVTCYGETAGLYSKNVNIRDDGNGSRPVVNISNGSTSFEAIRPRNGKITISGSIVTADSIYGYDSENSVIEDSIVFNGTDGQVCGDVEITDDFQVPEGATLSVQDGAVLSVLEDVVLSVPDGASLQVPGTAQIVNNGTIVLPEDNGTITPTGTGIIKKGDNHYTNDNEQLYPVTIKLDKGESTEYHKEGSKIKLVPEAAADGRRFKEWKIIPDTVVITDNLFMVPAEAVIIEAVYEEKNPATETPVITETPAVTETPVITETPAVTETPVITETPAVTESPDQTGSPEPAETTEPTGSPEQTQVPAETPVPAKKPANFIPYPYIPVKNIITVKISANPAIGGKVSGNLEAMEGENIKVTAVADTGYTFTEWTEDGNRVSTDAEYTFKAEKNRVLTAVFKKNMPENTVPGTINAANNIKTLSSVSLPDGWEWSREDSSKAVPAGGSVTAKAVYTAKDANDYINTSLLITITRDACEEDQTVLYTLEGEYKPGCTTEGTGHTECRLCGDIIKKDIKIPAAGHTEDIPVIKKATVSKDGSSTIKCVNCNQVLNSTIIDKIATIKLSKTQGTYNKKIQHPSIYIKDSKGNVLEQDTDYTVSWAKGMNKAGIYDIGITFTGKYEGTANKTYKIIPKGTSILRIKARRKGFNLKWKKQAIQTTGFQIQYSTSKGFTDKTSKKVTIKTIKENDEDIKCDKANKKYYVRIRTYKNVKAGGKTAKVFSGWSKVKTVKTK